MALVCQTLGYSLSLSLSLCVCVCVCSLLNFVDIHMLANAVMLFLSSTDGRVKMWVYGVSGGSFLIMIFLVFTSYLVW